MEKTLASQVCDASRGEKQQSLDRFRSAGSTLDSTSVCAAKGHNASPDSITWQGLKRHWRSAVTSFVVNLCIVMEGYSMNLLANLFIHKKFLHDFGTKVKTSGEYKLSSNQQLGLMLAVQCGAVLGLYIAGWLCDKLGYRRLLSAALLLSAGLSFISVFAETWTILCVGQFFVGIPFGMFQSLTLAYANEISPRFLRAPAASTVNIDWLLGQLLSSVLVVIVENRTDYWAWRYPFLVVTGVSFALLLYIIFAALESPVWLVRKARHDEARAVLCSLSCNGPEGDRYVSQRLEEICETIKEEEQTGAATWSQLFCGLGLHRLLITTGTWSIQALCGTALLGMSGYYFKNVGLSTHESLFLTIGQHSLGIVGTALSWYLMAAVNRRPILLGGLGVVAVQQLLIGSLGCVHETIAVSWAIAVVLVLFAFTYNSTIAPVVYAILPEIPSNTLRTKTLSTARAVYLILNIVNYVLIPKMLNPDAWHWGAKTGFVFLGTCGLCLTCAYYFMPETKPFTTGAINWLFEQRVKERNFRRTWVPPHLQAVINIPSANQVGKTNSSLTV